MRVHINHYKCHLCDMTCSKPSMLAKHIRYRHLPDRPFTCKVCQHRTVSRQDLVAHARTHDTQAALSCERRGCDFSCRSKWALVRHRATRHDRNWAARYACHCCPAMFTRGAILTKHLIRVHDFHWPSGHSRFLYKQDTRTGLFHLQLVRYESLEVTQVLFYFYILLSYSNSKKLLLVVYILYYSILSLLLPCPIDIKKMCISVLAYIIISRK